MAPASGLFEPIFAALDDIGVRSVVVGGVATVLHGHARLTQASTSSWTSGPTNHRGPFGPTT